VLQGRLTAAAAIAAGVLVLVSCASADGTDGGVIRENVVEPGITAIEEARTLSCDADAQTLQTALDLYEVTEGEPAPDEAALVTAGFLREESQAWDVVDGALVAQDASCGPVDPAPTTTVLDIVTDTEPAFTADELYATFSPEQITAIGGEQCARELAEIYAAGDRFVTERGDGPETMADLVDAGLLEREPELWTVVDDELVGVDGSGCQLRDG
jgi:hypothetical protein